MAARSVGFDGCRVPDRLLHRCRDERSFPSRRYAVPLVPALAVAAGAFSADLLQRPAWRRAGAIATTFVLGVTVLYAAAYMNVFIKPDSRLVASQCLLNRVAAGSRILIEPSHNIPPMGSYLTNPDFKIDYVLWQESERNDYYQLFALDTYRYLYDLRPSPEEKREDIRKRVGLVDYIVMDDTFLQFYHHRPASRARRRQAGPRRPVCRTAGLQTDEEFQGLSADSGGIDVNDDAGQLGFRLFDHPRVFVFAREAPRLSSPSPPGLHSLEPPPC